LKQQLLALQKEGSGQGDVMALSPVVGTKIDHDLHAGILEYCEVKAEALNNIRTKAVIPEGDQLTLLRNMSPPFSSVIDLPARWTPKNPEMRE